jgi:hypothetical protein
MISDNESKRTLRIGLHGAGDYPTVDIVGVSEWNTLIRTLIDNGPAFAEVVAQFVADHSDYTPTVREVALIEVTETQLLS